VYGAQANVSWTSASNSSCTCHEPTGCTCVAVHTQCCQPGQPLEYIADSQASLARSPRSEQTSTGKAAAACSALLLPAHPAHQGAGGYAGKHWAAGRLSAIQLRDEVKLLPPVSTRLCDGPRYPCCCTQCMARQLQPSLTLYASPVVMHCTLASSFLPSCVTPIGLVLACPRSVPEVVAPWPPVGTRCSQQSLKDDRGHVALEICSADLRIAQEGRRAMACMALLPAPRRT
jgi:hypothetical protein